MKVENAKKIEVWELNVGSEKYYHMPFGVFYKNTDSNGDTILCQSKYIDFQNLKKDVELLAELEAKEQKEETIDWVEFDCEDNLYRTKDGVEFQIEVDDKWCWVCNPRTYYESNKDAILKANGKPNNKTYEQLEMEANIKKLEWTIAEQQLEIERLRQKELELTKGKNNE